MYISITSIQSSSLRYFRAQNCRTLDNKIYFAKQTFCAKRLIEYPGSSYLEERRQWEQNLKEFCLQCNVFVLKASFNIMVLGEL